MQDSLLVRASLRCPVFVLFSALIVTDAVLHKIGAVKPLTDLLTKLNIKFTMYDGCEPNPTVEQVGKKPVVPFPFFLLSLHPEPYHLFHLQVVTGAKMATDNGCDFVMSFGGGSPHDCAKAVAALITNGGKVQDMEGLNNVKKPMLPLVTSLVVPTCILKNLWHTCLSSCE